MTEAEFLTLYRDTLTRIEETVENAIQHDDADMDYEAGNDMLTLIFNNRSVAILSRQSAICQLWLAARSGGFHFEYDSAAANWICTVNQQALPDMLQQICLEQGGVTLHFAP